MRVRVGGGGTLPQCRFPPPPAIPIDYVHRDEIGEIVSSILLKSIQKLQMTRLFSIPLSIPIDYVHRDEIGEIVSSILLKGIQKLQMTRLFSIPLIIT